MLEEDSPLTPQEKSLIKEHGVCKVTNKPLLMYCYDCSEILCNTCFLKSHRNHSVVENDFREAESIFSAVKESTVNMHEERVAGLGLKIKQLEENNEAIENMGKLNFFYEDLANSLTTISEKIVVGPICRISEWVEANNEKTRAMRNEIRARSEAENKDYKTFSSYLQDVKNCKAKIKACLCQSFVNKKKKQMENDEKYFIDEVPSFSEEIQEEYFELFENIISGFIKNLLQSIALVKAKNEPETLTNTYKRMKSLIKQILSSNYDLKKIQKHSKIISKECSISSTQNKLEISQSFPQDPIPNPFIMNMKSQELPDTSSSKVFLDPTNSVNIPMPKSNFESLTDANVFVPRNSKGRK